MSLAAQNRTRPRRTIEVLKIALLVLAAVLSAPLARAGQGQAIGFADRVMAGDAITPICAPEAE